MYTYFKVIAHTKYISSWKSKRLSDESIKPPATSDNSLSPLVDCLGDKIRLQFNGGCLKQGKLGYTHGKEQTFTLILNWLLLALTTTILQYETLCLVQLKTKILISTDILVMELDLIEEEVFHFQVMNLASM